MGAMILDDEWIDSLSCDPYFRIHYELGAAEAGVFVDFDYDFDPPPFDDAVSFYAGFLKTPNMEDA